MDKGNILFFCPREVNATMGGIERVTDSLARYLIKHGFNVVFMSVEHTCTNTYECVAPQYFTKRSDNLEWILEIISKHRINIIINQMGFFSYCPKSALPEWVKIITVMHDSHYAIYPRLQLNFIRKWNWKRVVSKTLRKTYNQSDKIVVFVPPFKEEFRFFCPHAVDKKFTVIPNFNTYNQVDEQPKDKRIVWVGRLSENCKRTCDILRIWSLIESKFPEWSIDIIGDGPDKKLVENTLSELHLQRCYLRGTQDPTEYYQRASITCVTSAFESFCMVLTEGMQHGCVPIVYDSYTAVRYIVTDGKDGFLVHPFDINEYANKLSLLMADEERRYKMSLSAVETVKQFDSTNIMPKWIELIESL